MQSSSNSSLPQNERRIMRVQRRMWRPMPVLLALGLQQLRKSMPVLFDPAQKPLRRFMPVLCWTAIVLALVGTSGCRLLRPCYQRPVSSSASSQKVTLEPSDPAKVNPILIPYLPENEKGRIPDGFKQVFPLTIEQCERLASQHSPVASILEMESNQGGACQGCSSVDPCVRDTMNSVIAGNANYQRNLTSEKALLAYLGLVEVYLQNQLLDETITEIEELQSVLAKLQEEGLLRQVDPEMLTRKKLEALEQRNDLLFTFERLNESLRLLLGLESKIHPVWTSCEIPTWQIPESIAAEITTALENRSDLQSIQSLSSVSNDQLLNTLRNSVRSVSPFAGLVLERRLFGGYFADNSAEIAKLRSQLSALHSTQQDLIRAQVSEHFYAVFKNKELIELKRQKLESLRKSEARLDAKRQVGPIEVDEVLSVKSELLKCRSELIHAVVELQMSWIRLKGSQGILGLSFGSNSAQNMHPQLNPHQEPHSLDHGQREEIELLGAQPQINAARGFRLEPSAFSGTYSRKSRSAALMQDRIRMTR